ncbi:MAG: competence/damage-inducible protein A [Candidatus Brocadiales bacterium]
MKTAEIISTGSELLHGDVVNTNAACIAGELTRLGITVLYHTTVGDDLATMGSALEQALDRVDLIIVTGGLGPTRDDLTRNAVATATGKRLVKDDAALSQIEEAFRCRQAKMPSSNIRQAMIPEGSTVIQNKMGTAPGFHLNYNNTQVICMPGVPEEMKGMFRDWVVPHIRRQIDSRIVRLHRKIHAFGVHEATVGEKISHMMSPESNPTIGTMVHDGTITLRMTAEAGDEARARAILEGAETEIRGILGDSVYGTDDDTLEGAVAALLKKHRVTMAVAESLTGGLVGNFLTDVPGTSEFLLEDIVVYTYRSKSRLIGVPEGEINKKGAANAETAAKMAQAVREKAGADFGLSTTGVAGPTSLHPDEPVGLVYVALATQEGVVHWDFHFRGGRKWIKLMAAKSALDMVRLKLLAL